MHRGQYTQESLIGIQEQHISSPNQRGKTQELLFGRLEFSSIYKKSKSAQTPNKLTCVNDEMISLQVIKENINAELNKTTAGSDKKIGM